MTLLEVPTWGHGMLFVFLAVLGAALFYWRWLPEESGLFRGILLCLRGLTVGIMVLILLRPAITQTQSASLKGGIVLLDRSASMALPAGSDESRYQQGLKAGKQLKQFFAREGAVQTLSFADTVAEVWPERPGGSRSALTPVLKLLSNRTAARRPVVVLSDGAVEAPDRLNRIAHRFAREGRSISTFFPREAPVQERRIVDVSYSRQVRQGKKTKLRVTVRGNGRFPLFLRGPEVEVRKMVPAGTGVRTLTLSYRPRKLGAQKLILRVPEAPGEQAGEDNRLTIGQDVIRPRKRSVLVAWERPTWDVRTIVGALREIKDIKVIETDGSLTPPGQELIQYDALILTGLPAETVREDHRRKLRELVRSGAGLAMLGGEHSFAAGGWDKTGLADVLPVEPGTGEVLEGNPHQPELTRLGRRHKLLQPFGATLPAVKWINRWARVKPGGRVLARVAGRNKELPFVVEGRAGRGRVVAIAGGGFWRWVYRVDSGREKLSNFWNRLVGRLAPEPEKGLIVNFPRQRSRTGEPVTVQVKASGLDGQINWSLTGAGLNRSGRLSANGGEVTLRPVDTGVLKFTASNRKASGRTVKSVAYSNVESRAYEFREPGVARQRLNDLARITGGNHGYFQEAQKKMKQLNLPENRIVSSRQPREIWDQPWLLTLFVGLLGIEWTTRRLSGLR